MTPFRNWPCFENPKIAITQICKVFFSVTMSLELGKIKVIQNQT